MGTIDPVHQMEHLQGSLGQFRLIYGNGVQTKLATCVADGPDSIEKH